MPPMAPHAGVLKAVDKDLPPCIDGNLAAFRRKHEEIATAHNLLPEDIGPHTAFALTGHYHTEDNEHYRMRVLPEDGNVQVVRLQQYDDVDSGLGFIHRGDVFPLKEGHTFFYSMFNNTSMTLNSPLHLPCYEFTDADGNPIGLEYHLIPNAVCGHIGGANVQKILVRFFFPALACDRDGSKGNHVNAAKMKALYDKAVRLAVDQVIPRESRHEWALTFSLEQFRAGTATGGVVFTPRSIIQPVIDQFFEAIHKFCDETLELKWARGFFLQFQIQGCKSSTKHFKLPPQLNNSMSDDDIDPVEADFEQKRSDSILRALDPLDWHKMVLQHWYLDVATTFHFSDAGYSLFPKRQTHPLLLGALTGINSTEASTLVTRGAKVGYYLDEIAHLGNTAGMRVDMLKGPFISPLNVYYAQVYASGDKDLTALKDKNRVAKHMEPQFAFSNFDHVMNSFLAPLSAVFQAAVDQQQTVNVRIESRVPLMDAATVHRWLDPSQFAGYMIKVKTKDYWSWKLIRLQAIIATLTKMHLHLPKIPQAKLNPAATLVVGLCFMANALVNRPEAGPDFDSLADTLSVHEITRGVLVAVRPLVAFFLHSLLLEDACPRISMVRVLELPQIARLCHISGDTTGSEIADLIKRSKVRSQGQAGLPQWGQNPDGGDPAPVVVNTLANHSGVSSVSRSKRNKIALGYDEPEALFGDAENIPELPMVDPFVEEADDPEEAPQVLTNRTVLNEIFHRMAGEMLLKVPDEGQTKTSWRIGTDTDCHGMRFKDLCDSRTIDRMLRGYRITTDPAVWDRTVKKILPTGTELCRIKYKPGTNIQKPRYLQGLAQCYFFIQWMRLVENEDRSLTAKQLEDLVRIARIKLDEQAQWLPVGKQDRLWGDVGAKNAKIHGTQINGKEPPVVVLNPRFPRDPNVPGGY